MSTWPLGNNVAVCLVLGWVMLPVGVKAPGRTVTVTWAVMEPFNVNV
jgi:hypothetical protein